MSEALRIRMVSAARALVGVRFRVRGRTAETGLDCVGVVLAAAVAAGARLRGDDAFYCLTGDELGNRLREGLRRAGLFRLDTARAGPGDVLCFDLGNGIPHLGIRTPTGLVNAHTGLGRVVEQSAPPNWRISDAWRLPEED